jgi:hypothetical protein
MKKKSTMREIRNAVRNSRLRAQRINATSQPVSKINSKEKVTFEQGATRTHQTARFDLIPAIASLRRAKRFAKGAVEHGENNWRKGGAEFIKSCYAHLESHLNDLKINGNADDDNLAAMGWAVDALMWFEEFKPTEFERARIEINHAQKDGAM